MLLLMFAVATCDTHTDLTTEGYHTESETDSYKNILLTTVTNSVTVSVTLS